MELGYDPPPKKKTKKKKTIIYNNNNTPPPPPPPQNVFLNVEHWRVNRTNAHLYSGIMRKNNNPKPH